MTTIAITEREREREREREEMPAVQKRRQSHPGEVPRLWQHITSIHHPTACNHNETAKHM
jgi:hypothetical protein